MLFQFFDNVNEGMVIAPLATALLQNILVVFNVCKYVYISTFHFVRMEGFYPLARIYDPE